MELHNRHETKFNFKIRRNVLVLLVLPWQPFSKVYKQRESEMNKYSVFWARNQGGESSGKKGGGCNCVRGDAED